MINQHHTDNPLSTAKQICLAVLNLRGRLLNIIILSVVLSVDLNTLAFAEGVQRTRAQAVQIAKSRSGDGRVLSVNKKVNKNGVSVFAVKIIVNGRVKVYSIPEFAK